MAGGKITRTVGGTNSIECETWTVYTDKFTAYAGKGSHFTADGGTTIGEPKDPPPVGHYFVKGWWTDDNDKPIKEATIGEKVKFHLQTQNIPQNDTKRQVKMELRDFEDFSLFYYILGFETDKFKGYDKISIMSYDKEGTAYSKEHWDIDSEQKVVIKLVLGGDSLIKMISEEHDRDLELYFRATYIDSKNYIEVLHFPEMESDYLKVKPPPLVEPIIFVEASNTHKLPAIYSAEDGTPWIVNLLYNPDEAMEKASTFGGLREIKKEFTQGQETAENIEMISNFFKENGGGAYTPEEINKFSKRSYDIAIRKLKKGNLIFNDGSNGVTNRYHKYTVADIDSRFSEEITMGVNRGKFATGLTSKGINQLEAQAGRGLAKVFKTVGDVIPVLDTLCDLADILTSAANGTRPPLPFTPPFVSWEITKMFDEMYEDFRKTWVNLLHKEILKGKSAVKRYMSVNEYSDGQVIKNIGYELIEISEDTIEKILKKEIKEIDIKNDFSLKVFLEKNSNSNTDSGILVQTIDSKDDYNRPTKNHYIHAIFINNLKV